MTEQYPVNGHSSLPEKVVVIGGGTGNSTVVRAFTQKPFTGEGVTAIATTFDDGGGTGELRKVYADLPAVGDIRQCFDAMSQLSDRALIALAGRFGEGDFISEGLNVKGQTMGNLVIARTIQSELKSGGTFSSALEIVGEIFQAKGRVAPPSDDIRRLVFDLPDGTRIIGEHNAEDSEIPSLDGTKISFLDGQAGNPEEITSSIKPAQISEEADTAVREADIVVLAPGDLYTSIGPNLAVQGMKEALKAAKVVMMVSNLMNRNRHTVGFTTADYVREYERIIGDQVIDKIIYNKTRLDPSSLKAQAAKGSYPVRPNVKALKEQGRAVYGFDLLSHDTVALDPNDSLLMTRSEIRHDPAKLATAALIAYLHNGYSKKRAY